MSRFNSIVAVCFAVLLQTPALPAVARGQETVPPRTELPQVPNQQDVVSPDMAQEIAVMEAKGLFGAGAISEPIIGYDLAGGIRAYTFVIAVGSATFPADRAILSELQDARNAIPEAKEAVALAREEWIASGGNVTTQQVGQKQLLRRGLPWEQAQARLRQVEELSTGTGKYATVVVSARKDLAPIMTSGNGLPPYYTWRDRAEAMAADSLRAPVRLTRLIIGGPLDQIFEFESLAGAKVWVVLFPPRIAVPGSIALRESSILALFRA